MGAAGGPNAKVGGVREVGEGVGVGRGVGGGGCGESRGDSCAGMGNWRRRLGGGPRKDLVWVLGERPVWL